VVTALRPISFVIGDDVIEDTPRTGDVPPLPLPIFLFPALATCNTAEDESSTFCVALRATPHPATFELHLTFIRKESNCAFHETARGFH
jgi:hypothetical protein